MDNLVNNKIVLFVAVLLIIAGFIFAPFVLIWSLNTLFPILVIEYTWQTWLAVSSLFAVIHMLTYRSNKHSHG